MADAPDGSADPPVPATDDGAGLVSLAWAGTGAFVATSVAATLSPDGFGPVAAVFDGLLFAAGTVAFLWAFAIAVQRSRHDAIGIGGLYFLTGTAPRQVRFRFLLALAIEVVVAVASASIRPYTSVAFGILVPMFGLGLSGLWGARYGRFEPRSAAAPARAPAGDPADTGADRAGGPA